MRSTTLEVTRNGQAIHKATPRVLWGRCTPPFVQWMPLWSLISAQQTIAFLECLDANQPTEPGRKVASEWGRAVDFPCSLTLIGSAGLLWHAHRKGVQQPLPENSMDADPVTEDEEVALLAYDAMIGSEFELTHGWHVNLMPKSVLRELPDWLGKSRLWKKLTLSCA